MSVEVREHPLGGGILEAYYTTRVGSPVLAVDPDLEPVRRRMWEMVAHGFTLGRDPGRHFLLTARDTSEVDLMVVHALRRVLWAMEPEWILDVLDARCLAEDPRVMAAWCELPLEVVLAALALSGAWPPPF